MSDTTRALGTESLPPAEIARRRPSWQAVARQQLVEALPVGWSRFWLVVGTTITAVSGYFNRIPGISITLRGDAGEPLVTLGSTPTGMLAGIPGLLTAQLALLIIALVKAAEVWEHAEPSRRGFHHSMPVERRRHDLLKVAGGAAELAGVTLLLVAAGWLPALAAGYGDSLAELTPGAWSNLLLGPLALFLLASIAALRSRRRAAWVLGGLALSALASPLAQLAGGGVLAAAADALTVGPVGFFPAIVGDFLSVALGPELLDGEPPFSGGAWPWAQPFWLAVGMVGVAVSLGYRPRDS